MWAIAQQGGVYSCFSKHDYRSSGVRLYVYEGYPQSPFLIIQDATLTFSRGKELHACGSKPGYHEC
eukprot:m.112646 g.112646  ORF g.112646 m.112646 type:complete len:66 (+) comp14096_c0_seq2:137-334(+)